MAAKGRSWSKEEDAIVVQTIRQDDTPSAPFTRWAELATTLCKQLPGSVRRTGKQCRDRYVNYLHPALTHEPFSREDDLKLWNGYKDLGNKWTAISETIFHNTRSENHVKNRYNSATFKRFVREEYGESVYEATKLAHGCAIPSQLLPIVGPVKRKAVSPKKAPEVVHKKYGGSPSMMPGLPVLPTPSEEVSRKRIHSHALPFAPWASEATTLPNNEHGMALPIVKRKKINEGWSPEEDALVTKAISHAKTNGGEDSEFTNWAYLATLLPGRKGKQIRDRWKNYLNPALNHEPFSEEEDIKLWNACLEYGNRWVDISIKVFNSTRSENHVKNRYNSATFKKFVAEKFGVDVNRIKELFQDGTLRQQRQDTKKMEGLVSIAMGEKIAVDAEVKKGVITTGQASPDKNSVLWTKEEDGIIITAVAAQSDPSNISWATISTKYLPRRTGRQIRERYSNHLNPRLNRGPFTQEEDLKLWHAHIEYGKRWTEIGTRVFNSTRSENQIKNRWHGAAFKNIMTEKFGPDAYENAKGGVQVKGAASSGGELPPLPGTYRDPSSPSASLLKEPSNTTPGSEAHNSTVSI